MARGNKPLEVYISGLQLILRFAMETLKREFLELLDKDVEFRYAVAGFLGLSEIMKRLDAIAEEQANLRKEQIRLREGQTEIWTDLERIWEEIKALREGQNNLWEGQVKLWEEVKSLREGQVKLWEEVKMLRVNYDRMRKYMLSGFRELRATLGVAFEDHAAAFLEVMLEEMGYPDARVGKKILAYHDEAVEINLFCEEPLIVGEATISVKRAEEAEREIRKLLDRVRIVEERYRRKPEMVILSVARATEEAIEVLKNLTKEHGVKLVLGKEIEEELAI